MKHVGDNCWITTVRKFATVFPFNPQYYNLAVKREKSKGILDDLEGPIVWIEIP